MNSRNRHLANILSKKSDFYFVLLKSKEKQIYQLLLNEQKGSTQRLFLLMSYLGFF